MTTSLFEIASQAAFGRDDEKLAAHCLAWNLALERGIFPASIETLYRNFAQGKHVGLTVPAMNMRAIAFESARGVFRAMAGYDVGAAIFELSRGEIGFTGQRPLEYATVILCAAIVENHVGPLFLQGDHFQVSASRYAQDPNQEVDEVKSLIREAVAAGFYNIDIDTSTLVDLSHDNLASQQATNIALTAELASFTRGIEPENITISLGGEIGEVGEENSTVEEVETYLRGVSDNIGSDDAGLSKLSIQSGTRHGGNVLPDGSFGDMNVDFELIGRLTEACRRTGALGACVQHGASMLSLEKIGRLPSAGCIEVHLAAAFLNSVYDHLPAQLVQKSDGWVKETKSDEWKDDWSEAQFLHHARRYPIGKFKQQWWQATSCHDAVRDSVSQKAIAYFQALNVQNTKELVAEVVAHERSSWSAPETLESGSSPRRDEAMISDLAD